MLVHSFIHSFNLIFCLLFQALGKITDEGVFLEQLETNVSKYLPEIESKDLSSEVVQVSKKLIVYLPPIRAKTKHVFLLIVLRKKIGM